MNAEAPDLYAAAAFFTGADSAGEIIIPGVTTGDSPVQRRQAVTKSISFGVVAAGNSCQNPSGIIYGIIFVRAVLEKHSIFPVIFGLVSLFG